MFSVLSSVLYRPCCSQYYCWGKLCWTLYNVHCVALRYFVFHHVLLRLAPGAPYWWHFSTVSKGQHIQQHVQEKLSQLLHKDAEAPSGGGGCARRVASRCLERGR